MDNTQSAINLEELLRPLLLKIDQLQLNNITEIMFNEDGYVYVEDSGKIQELPITYGNEDKENIVETISGMQNLYIGEHLKTYELATSINTSKIRGRIHAILPPIVTNTVIAIRIPRKNPITIEELIKNRTLTQKDANTLEYYIAEKKNILISGATSSGKTAILNALLNTDNFIKQKERILIIEDTKEIISLHKNTVSMLVNQHYTYADAIRAALRLRPDRILIGEIRDGNAAVETCKAWRTGHSGGIGTIHAENPQIAIKRLLDLFGEVMQNPSKELADTIDVIIQAKRIKEGGVWKRKITNIIEAKEHFST